MKITQSFTSVAYPQANGQTEVTNSTIVQALRARLYGVGKDWVEELSSVLWAYQTTHRAATGETPFSQSMVQKLCFQLRSGRHLPEWKFIRLEIMKLGNKSLI